MTVAVAAAAAAVAEQRVGSSGGDSGGGSGGLGTGAHVGSVGGAHARHRERVRPRAVLPLQVVGVLQHGQHLRQCVAGQGSRWKTLAPSGRVQHHGMRRATKSTRPNCPGTCITHSYYEVAAAAAATSRPQHRTAAPHRTAPSPAYLVLVVVQAEEGAQADIVQPGPHCSVVCEDAVVVVCGGSGGDDSGGRECVCVSHCRDEEETSRVGEAVCRMQRGRVQQAGGGAPGARRAPDLGPAMCMYLNVGRWYVS